jgi:hypothetical protein
LEHRISWQQKNLGLIVHSAAEPQPKEALGTQQSAISQRKPKSFFTAEARRRGEDKINFSPLITLIH